MMRRSVVALMLVIVLPLCGCHVTTRPRVVAEATEGRKVSVQTTRYDGEYRLYAAERPAGEPWPRPVGEPLASHRLRQREALGFRRHGGELSAVAGASVIPLSPGAYLWEMRADPGQPDWNKTVLLIGVGLAVGLGFAGATVSAAAF